MTTVLEDPFKPFVTTVYIDGVEYGSGAYLNKKQSKQLAAEATLEMLCPGLFPKSKDLTSEQKLTGKVSLDQQFNSILQGVYELSCGR